jgi:hypothetical protein
MLKFFLKLLATAGGLFLAWVLLVSLAPGDWVAAGAPCPRNLAWGPAWLPRASPLDSVSIALPGGKARLCYGRPSLRGRTMIGGDAVPYGKLWRLGANEPTTLHTSRILYVGDLVLAPGSYSLYAIPGIREWEIIVNRSIRQWGLESEYDDEVLAQEVGRIRVQAQHLDSPVETLTFRAQPAATSAVELVFEWQETRWRLPLDTSRSDFDTYEESEPDPE